MSPPLNSSSQLTLPVSSLARAKAADEKFVKLREVYQKLRSEHIVLLRTNGETQKNLQSAEKDKSGMEEEVKVREMWMGRRLLLALGHFPCQMIKHFSKCLAVWANPKTVTLPKCLSL